VVSVRISGETPQQQQQQVANLQAYSNRNAEMAIKGDVVRGGVNPSMYTGYKPVHGSQFVFQSLIISAKEPAWLQAQYMKSSLGIPFKAVVVLIGLIIVGIAWKLLGRRAHLVRIGVIVLLALLAYGIRTLTEGAYRGYFSTLIVTLVVVAIAMLAHTIVSAIRDSLRRRREAEAARIAELTRKADQPQPAPEPEKPE